jgi:DNA-binding NtrC family response regulator
MVAAGGFREDLFARLNGVSVTLPPLQQRRADVGMLIGSLLRRTRGADSATFTPAAARAMLSSRWPRNVRELGHALVRAGALAGGGRIVLEHLPAVVAPAGAPLGDDVAVAPLDRDDPELRQTFASALDRHHGNLVAVGRELDKHREQLHRWARRFEFDLESFRR